MIAQALNCFVEQGIEAAKISDIAQRANLMERSVYRYFATKADLVLETALLFWSETMQQVDALVQRKLSRNMCGTERISKILQGYADPLYPACRLQKESLGQRLEVGPQAVLRNLKGL